MWLLNGTVQPWLSCSSNLFFYLGSMPLAKSVSPSATDAALSRARIQSVSFTQFFGEIVVVGSHLALSAQSRQGQSTMDSIDAGSLFGKSLYVHLPSWSSFSLRMSPFSSSFKATLEPSLLLAPRSRHSSD